MNWSNLMTAAFALVVAIIVIGADLPPHRALVVMAMGFGVAVVADVLVARLLKRRAIQQEEYRLATMSRLELDILHAYREPTG